MASCRRWRRRACWRIPGWRRWPCGTRTSSIIVRGFGLDGDQADSTTGPVARTAASKWHLYDRNWHAAWASTRSARQGVSAALSTHRDTKQATFTEKEESVSSLLSWEQQNNHSIEDQCCSVHAAVLKFKSPCRCHQSETACQYACVPLSDNSGSVGPVGGLSRENSRPAPSPCRRCRRADNRQTRSCPPPLRRSPSSLVSRRPCPAARLPL